MFRGSRGKQPRLKPHDEADNSDPDVEDVEQGRPRQLTSRKTKLRWATTKNISKYLGQLGVNQWRLRRLDLSMTEKLWSFVDTLQIFALLWSLSQPWPWPRPWLTGTRWTVAVNLDVVSIYNAAMTVTGPGTKSSPWGERQGYVFYALVFALVPVGMQTLWSFREILTTFGLDRGVAFHRIVLGQGKPKPPAAQVVSALIAFERALLFAAHIIYLPVVLAVCRLLICDSDGTLSVDPSMSCRSPFLVLPAMFGCAVVVLFTIDLTKRTTDAAHAVTTYRDKSDHERYLQRVEVEYALSLCNAWEADHLWMISSFRRHSVNYRVHLIYLKLALVLVYSFGRFNISGQVVVFWGLMTAWSMWTCAHPPYRIRSSNRLHIVLHAVLWTDCLLGMMTGYGVRSAMLVASAQFRLLIVLNIIGAVAAIGVVVAFPVEEALERRRRRREHREKQKNAIPSPAITPANPITSGPSGPRGEQVNLVVDADGDGARSGGPDSQQDDDLSRSTEVPGFVVVDPDRWPTRATLASLARLPRRREWVKAIRKAKDFRFQCEMCPKGLEPIRSLEAFMREVRTLWAEAKAEDSALEPALGSALERLALVHAQMLRDAGDRGRGLTKALEEALLDEAVMSGIRRRGRAQALMTDLQKRVMLKLLAVAAFLNHRDLRDSSAASVRRLREDTDRVLSQPLTSESRAPLKTICTQWKRLIQKSEREFEEAHGRPPYLSDKEANSEWYECYNMLHSALDKLPKVESEDRMLSSLVDVIGGREDYPESLALTPAASESVSTLIRATEQLLSTGESPRGAVELVEAETCRKEWKRVIRLWEADFEDHNGKLPKVSDKQIIRSYYEYYRRLRDLLATTA